MQQGHQAEATVSNVGGVDTHKDHHVAAVVDPVGRPVATESFRNDRSGHQQLAAWLTSHGPVVRVGVEGTGSYGAELSRTLRQSGLAVIEVNRPNRQRRRRHGKNDTIDAIGAAMAVLSREATAIPKLADGPVESLRMVRLARRSAVKARTQALNQFQAILDTAASAVREELSGLSVARAVERAAQFRPGNLTDPRDSARWVLARLARRIQHLNTEIGEFDTEQRRLVSAASAGRDLLARPGIGPETAAALLCVAGDNPDRMHSEASFAALCGVSPVEASSGRSNRHRLNLGGDRRANNALWWIVITRIRTDQQTRSFLQRRTAAGKSKKDTIRVLKRYVAREVYRTIRRATAGSFANPAQVAP
ncbi:transposase [Nocardia sp. GAS34]|uniref:IS110 family transposase n=1 Tax=unclassified Nocardia TaxID=2637762 RepID=UPI003D217AFC